MKKFISLLLMVCIIAVMTSCGNTGENIGDTVDTETEPTYKDMGGAKFLFNTGWTNEYFPEEGYSDSGDKMRTRYKETAELFNCEFNVVLFTEVSASTLITAAVATGTDIPDLIDTHAVNSYPVYKAGLLYPLNNITTIDLSETKWGPEKFRSYGIWNGDSYGFFSYDWEFIPQFEGCLLFNNELIKSMGLQNPYEMQSRDEWTWANFKEELVKATQTVGEVAVKGLQIAAMDRTAQTAIFSNGVRTIQDKDGKKVFGYNSPEAYAALDYLKDIVTTKVAAVNGTITEFSKALKYVYYAGESWLGTVNTDGQPDLPSLQLQDYGFMPFPHGPNGTKDTVSAYVHIGRRLNFVVGVSDNDPEDIGTVINYVFSPLADSEPEAWKKLAKKSVFHHTEGYDNFVYMTENANYDFSAELFDVRAKISGALIKATGSGTPSAAIDAIKDLVQVEIDESMNVQP